MKKIHLTTKIIFKKMINKHFYLFHGNVFAFNIESCSCNPISSDLGRYYLERIEYLITNMGQSIDDVINYSRVNFLGRKYKKTDLNKLFKEIIRDLKDIITQKNAKISVAHLPVLNIIPQQIQQLFSNLIINSIIFSKDEEDHRNKN